MMCSRCKKRPAVMFISTVSGGERKDEGLCLQCASELNLPQMKEFLKKWGINEDDVKDALDSAFDENGQLNTNAFSQFFDMKDNSGEDIGAGFDIPEFEDEGSNDKDEDLFERGGAGTMPSFLKNLFGSSDSSKKDDNDDEKKSKKKQEKIDKKRKCLETFCTNLTRRAKEGKIDRIIGRENEIYRVLQILSRRTKNNPCLIGEPGVGKTAIAEGIALKLASGDVPFRLQGKELYLLDLTALVAGTQFRGQFESRVKTLIDEVKNAGNVMLFVDEVHNLVGTGGDSEGSMNAANIFKPALSRGELQVIGATTFSEYRKHIEKDSALERRFQPVTVNEPTIEETIELLGGIKQYYEEHHKVHVSDEIAKMCALLSERYINDRFLPDKAIDLLDESCACASLGNESITEYEKLKKQLKEQRLEESKLAEDSNIDYERLAKLKTEIAQTEQKTEAVKKEAEKAEVTLEDLSKVIELWTGIPANKIRETEFKKMASLEDSLKAKIIGQDEACELVSKAIKRTRVQLSNRRRPASFIFVGPTGVGKTELVKVLAKEMFDTVDPLIRLDMSEYMEKHSVSKIIGSPPGYVGYDEAGQLTERVRRKPYSVILFDEIEKAHPDVMNILLQILDEGKITDSQGRNVSFENTIIAMTSNAGSTNGMNGVGFAKSVEDMSKERAMKGLRDFLRPEFMARVDEIICFAPLSEENYAQIARLNLEELREPLSEKKLALNISDDVYKAVAKKAFGGKFGGRDIRRVIRSDIEDKIAELLIENSDETGFKSVEITANDDNIRVELSK
ncbi:MAG: ATP-dependent Clp protease ATP-binding subunit [Oscillospiraceae bacterium]|nr:ATP-dependent Clp protease ATP-binding subunit [Oscillospiraceae bacterium]